MPASSTATRRRPSKFKYQQLAQELADEIRTEFQPGERLHSEPDLCELHGVTRNTVRKSIDLLADQGLVERRGRAGNFVADAGDTAWDDRLFCVALPIRNHLWDQLFLSLSQQAIAHQRYFLISDFSGFNVGNSFGEVLPHEQRVERLSQALTFKPRTLVIMDASMLGDMREQLTKFRNLIVLQGERPVSLNHVANVRIDRDACWRLAGRHARQAGYQRLALMLTGGVGNIAQLQAWFASEEGGGFPMDQQTIFFEHHRSWPDDLSDYIDASDEPAAVLTAYDWGAHLVLQVLRKQGVGIPHQVGIYGMHNTPWSQTDDITSVHVDPTAWAEAIFQADKALDSGNASVDILVPPVITERASTQ